MSHRILVTGGSGFLATHTITQALEHGHHVRTTVRSASREPDVRAMVSAAGADPDERLDFAVADMTEDAGWAEAVAGCDFVLHIASPFPPEQPEDEDELVIPARDGAVRVLRAARDAGVRRVVMTSSFAAVGYGPPPANRDFDERDWTDPSLPGLEPYLKSKTVAEAAAWDFVNGEGGELELVVLNPVGIFGPVLGPDYASSVAIVASMLKGEMPRVPHIFFNVVDVRDVARAHLLAIDVTDAAGERVILASPEEFGLEAMARVLKDRLGDDAARISTKSVPNWVVRQGARFNPDLRSAARQVDKHRPLNTDKALHLLGWHARDPADTIFDTARSLIDGNLI